ncbi:hypothetical protein ABEB36_010987 [Hypothenemus hampei]|uniref:C2H2-type domain-containing protein n=1 Tax=Hypothenemus hampei TaxID=57062 RepID=A0ABD1EDT2_HYPHA
MMRDFSMNNCRCCVKVFCCEKCREKHEIKVHKVNPKCDICIYGKILFNLTDESLVKHIETTHLPLHCLNCKLVFRSIEDITEHLKCIKQYSISIDIAGTPYKLQDFEAVFHQDSPISTKDIINNNTRATSTPMQKITEQTEGFEGGKQIITPISSDDNLKTNKSIMKKNILLKSDHSSKLKVTFAESSNGKTDKLQEDEQKEDSTNSPVTPSPKETTPKFHSAKSDFSKESYETKSPSKYTTPLSIPNSSKAIKAQLYGIDDAVQEEETQKSDDKCELLTIDNQKDLWFENSHTKKELQSQANTSLEQYRKSMVLPTPILKRTNIKMKFYVPIKFASTPLLYSEELSTGIFRDETPFKTPQGKLHASQIPGIEVLSYNKGSSSFDEENEQKENCFNASTTTMTESSLWTSVKSFMSNVFGNFNSGNLEKSHVENKSASCKRQLSDPESSQDEISVEPCLKRFKLTDIKCRRPIRANIPEVSPRNIPSLATVEIIKSVSTLYGNEISKTVCDKATQTDDYLMYGWRPIL